MHVHRRLPGAALSSLIFHDDEHIVGKLLLLSHFLDGENSVLF